MDVAAWLEGLGLERYAPAFRDNEIDWDALPKLTAEDLKDLGVVLGGHRRKLLHAIAALGAAVPAAAAMAAAPDALARAEAERRQLTVMFCDLVGSTERGCDRPDRSFFGFQRRASRWRISTRVSPIILWAGCRKRSAVTSRPRALQPELADIHNNLGNALREQGKFDEAVASYQQALRIKPDFAHAWNNLGIVLAQKGQLSEAVAAFHKALELQPDYAVAYSNLGAGLSSKQGKPGEAIQSFREALRGTARLRGGVPQPGQRPAAARAVCQGRRKLSTSHRVTTEPAGGPQRSWNCTVLSRAGSTSRSPASDSIANQPGVAEAYNSMGNTLQKQGRFDEAAAAVEKALESSRSSPRPTTPWA